MFTASGAADMIPFEPSWSKAVHHLYVIQVDDRSAMQQNLASAHIGTGIHYPIPLHLQDAYAEMHLTRNALPVSEWAAERILSLPMFPSIIEADQMRVVKAVMDFRLRADAAVA